MTDEELWEEYQAEQAQHREVIERMLDPFPELPDNSGNFECDCTDSDAYNCAWDAGTEGILDDLELGSYEPDEGCNCPCHWNQ